MKNEEIEARNLAETNGAETNVARRPVFRPRVDVHESDEEVTILADVPGCDESSVSVELEGDVLTLTGEPRWEHREGLSTLVREFAEGTYRRTFSLSHEVDRDGISASVRNGVLRVALPRRRPDSRRIEIRST